MHKSMQIASKPQQRNTTTSPPMLLLPHCSAHKPLLPNGTNKEYYPKPTTCNNVSKLVCSCARAVLPEALHGNSLTP